MDRWTRQLLRRSALLPRPSTLKLNSLPLALTSISLPCAHPPPPPTNNEVMLYGTGREGVLAREMLHPAYKPPLCFVLAKIEKEGEVVYLQTSNLACMTQL